MSDFLAEHFDKLLLTGLFLVLVGIVVHMTHDGRDVAALNWAREQASIIIGSLLGLITEAVLRNGTKGPNDPRQEKENP